MAFLTESFTIAAAGNASTTAIASSTEAVITNIHICNESDSTDGQLLIEFYDSSNSGTYYKLGKYTISKVPSVKIGDNNLKDFIQLDTGDKLRFTVSTVQLIVTVQTTTRSV
jgi:hypothetical protein